MDNIANRRSELSFTTSFVGTNKTIKIFIDEVEPVIGAFAEIELYSLNDR